MMKMESSTADNSIDDRSTRSGSSTGSNASAIRLYRANSGKGRRPRSLRSVTEDFQDASLSSLLNNAAYSRRSSPQQQQQQQQPQQQDDDTRESTGSVHSCSSSNDKYIPLRPPPAAPIEKRRNRIPDLAARRQNSNTSDDVISLGSKSSMPSLASFNSESMRSKKSYMSANSSMDASDDSFSSLITADSSVCSFAHSVVSAKSTGKSPQKNPRMISRFVGDLKVRNVPVPPNDMVAGKTLDCIESVAIMPKKEKTIEKRAQRWEGTAPKCDALPRVIRKLPTKNNKEHDPQQPSRGNPGLAKSNTSRDVLPHVAQRRGSDGFRRVVPR